MSADPKEHPIVGPDHQLPAPPPEARQHKGIRILVWIALLLIFAVAFVLVIRHHNAPARAGGGRRGAMGGPVTLTTATAEKGSIGVYINSIGTVTPVYTASIVSQATGPIIAVHYTEGQMVQKGTPLVDIDPRPYQALLTQAEGTLERDQGILAQAKMDLARYKDAWSRDAIPRQTLEDQEKVVLQDEGTVKLDQGAVQTDQINLGYCHITAPFTGRVGLRLVDPGNVVQSSGTTTIAVVTQLQPMTIIFTIPEDNLSEIQPRLRQRAKMTVDAYDRAALKQIASGTLLTVDNQIDTTTGTVKARASFDNRSNLLFPNEFVNVRLLVDTQQDQVLIPTSTIQHNGDTAFVYTIKK